jgi:hypothetical protein
MSARVHLRHILLSDAAAVEDVGHDILFVALDDPPPVRSIIVVHDAEGARPVEVTKVVEVPEGDPRHARGIYGRLVDDEARQRAARVGTEQLPDGRAFEEKSPSDVDGTLMGGVSQMAMPAPVVDPDPSGPIDLHELRAIEHSGETGEPDDPDTGHTPDDAAGDDSTSEDTAGGSPPARKRRGRKRR